MPEHLAAAVSGNSTLLVQFGWGDPVTRRGSTGTFQGELAAELGNRNCTSGSRRRAYGARPCSPAATAKAGSQAVAATALAEVTALAEHCLLAELPDALPVVMKALADRAALDADVGHLADACPPWPAPSGTGACSPRTGGAHGGRRRTCRADIVGLPPACTGLDPDGAEALRGQVEAVHGAIGLLDTGAEPGPGLRERWDAVLHKLAARDTVTEIIRGRATRLLLDKAGCRRTRRPD
ncbi:hypothetical protein SBADM41S_08491 [Streptomyces badius]